MSDQDTEMKDAPEPIAGQERDVERKDAHPTATEGTKNVSTTSWFWLWSSAQNAQTNPPSAQTPAVTDDSATKEDAQKDAPATGQAEVQAESLSVVAQEPQVQGPAATATSKSSGWAFWFSAQPKTDESADVAALKQVGELAVSGTPSQSHPEAAQFNEEEQPKEELKEQAKPAEKAVEKRSFLSLRGRPKNKGVPKDTSTDTVC